MAKNKKNYQGLFFQFLAGLSSPIFGTVLVVMISFLILLSLVIPQKGFFESYEEWKQAYPILVIILERMGLTNIFESTLFLSLFTLTSLSIVFCTSNRLKRIWPRRARETLKGAKGEEIIFNGESLEVVKEKFKRELTKRLFLYRLEEEKGKIIFFASSSWKKLGGSALFHFSILLIGLGFLITRLFSLEGSLILTEGETIKESPQAYYQVATGKFFKEFEGFNFTLLSLFERFEKGTLVQSEADVSLISNRQEIREIIAPNYPLIHKDYRIVLKRIGPAPQLKISKKGQVVVSAFAKLIELKKGYYVDTFSFPQEDLTVTVRQKFQTDNYIISVYQGRFKKKFEVKLGEPVEFLTYQIVISTGRKWAEFFVVKDSGYPVTQLGFYFSLVGLSIAILIFEERVLICLSRRKKGVKVVIIFQRKRWRGKWEPARQTIVTSQKLESHST